MQAPALPSAVAAACASRLVAARSPACLGACRCRSHHAWGLPMRRQHLSARAQCLQGAGQPLVGRPDRRAHARCRASVPRLPRSDGDDGAARAARSPSTRSRIINPSSLISLLLKLISIVCLPLIGGEPCCCCRCTHRNCWQDHTVTTPPTKVSSFQGPLSEDEHDAGLCGVPFDAVAPMH